MQNKLFTPLIACLISLLLISCGDDKANASTQNESSTTSPNKSSDQQNISIKEIATIGDRIKFIQPNFMCMKKAPKLAEYFIKLAIAMEGKPGQAREYVNKVKKDTKGDCGLIDQRKNLIGQLTQKQKNQLNGAAYNYIKYKILSIDGKDYSSHNVHMWSVSFETAPAYEKNN